MTRERPERDELDRVARRIEARERYAPPRRGRASLAPLTPAQLAAFDAEWRAHQVGA